MTEKGFKILFEAHFEDIRRYLFFRSGDPALSTDIAQDTFMKVWEKQLDLEPGKDVRLLYKIAADAFISHQRRERLSRDFRLEQKPQTGTENPDDGINFKELLASYRKALKKLSGKQRIVFMMSRMDHLSYREISGRLGISIKAVEKRMNGALKTLRKDLDIQ